MYFRDQTTSVSSGTIISKENLGPCSSTLVASRTHHISVKVSWYLHIPSIYTSCWLLWNLWNLINSENAGEFSLNESGW